jgi:hypothetical protein
MGKPAILALAVLLLGSAARAEHAIAPEVEAEVVAVVTHEVCTTSEWGFGAVRTACRVEVLPAARGNPALKGICTTYYGRRTCH